MYLSLSILASIGIFWSFRMFQSYRIHTRQGIMINYVVAGITGLFAFQPREFWFDAQWFWPSAALGILFYVIFRVMAKVTQENGMSVSSIATKMSVVMPVSMGIIILDESLSWIKLSGITMGLISIVLSAGNNMKSGQWIWPMILFLGSGSIDSFLKLFQQFLVSEDAFPFFICNIFFSAFITSLVHHLFTKDKKIQLKTVGGGIVLGAVNFAALYFILKSLAMPGWESSIVFPINNFGIIAGSTLLAVIAFREKINIRGWLGFLFASLSILLLYFSK
ncbi:MAG: hypothetical protein WEC59_04930 [Salibacteraceae bacterium]